MIVVNNAATGLVFVKFFLGVKAPVFRKQEDKRMSCLLQMSSLALFFTPVRHYSLSRVLLSGCGFKFSVPFLFGKDVKYSQVRPMPYKFNIVVLTQHYVTPSMLANRNQTSNSFNPL